jgi:hypothetical protein
VGPTCPVVARREKYEALRAESKTRNQQFRLEKKSARQILDNFRVDTRRYLL